MAVATKQIGVADVMTIFNDPLLPVQSTAGVQKLHYLLTQFQHELQSMDGEVDYVLMLCRDVDADYDAYRTHLEFRLQILDLIQEIRSADTFDQARLLADMKLQLDRIEETTHEVRQHADTSALAAKKKIEPDRYYSYPEASEAVGVSKSTLRRQVDSGKIRTIRIGRLVRFVGSDLLAYQRERGGAEVRVLGE